MHIIGLHAADLIHEASNAVATKQSVQVCNGKHLTLATFRGIHRCFFCLMTRLVWDVSILPAVLPLCPPEQKSEAYVNSDVTRCSV